MRGFVSSGHELTSEAAAEILRSGGNAFDAAVAGLLAATVTEPLLASLAGGGFLLAETAGGERTIYDFFSDTPGKVNPEADFYPIQGDFGEATQEFHIGLGAMAVPGMAAGLHAVHAAHCRLPLSDLAGPAIAFAREGIALNDFQAGIAEILAPIVHATPEVETRFALPASGERPPRRDPELADFLETLAGEEAEWFYRGEPAAAIAALCRSDGGHLSRTDLAAYRCVRRPPLVLPIGGHRLATNPVPSCGGSLIAHALALMARLDRPDWQPGDPLWTPTLARVMATTTARRHAVHLQHRHDEAAAAELLGDAVLDQLAASLGAALAAHPRARGGTTHISVADAEGNLAATTVSNGEGCGRLLPGTGVHLNNFLGEEDLNPDGPGRWQPGIRLSSMMAPTIVDRADGARLALGSGGSNRLRTAITQVILRWALAGQALPEAIAAPRLHVEGDVLNFEPGFPPATEAALTEAFARHVPWAGASVFFGGVHAVTIDGHTLHGAADARRGGHAVRV